MIVQLLLQLSRFPFQRKDVFSRLARVIFFINLPLQITYVNPYIPTCFPHCIQRGLQGGERWEDVVYAWAAVSAQQKEIIPVQMGSVAEKSTSVACLSSLFPRYFAGLEANDEYPRAQWFLAVRLRGAASVLLLRRSLLLVGNFVLGWVQIDLFPRFWGEIVKFKTWVFVGSALTYSKALKSYSVLIRVKEKAVSTKRWPKERVPLLYNTGCSELFTSSGPCWVVAKSAAFARCLTPEKEYLWTRMELNGSQKTPKWREGIATCSPQAMQKENGKRRRISRQAYQRRGALYVNIALERRLHLSLPWGAPQFVMWRSSLRFLCTDGVLLRLVWAVGPIKKTW